MASALSSLLDLLRESHWTVSFAESCTGGLLASRMTSQSGISDVFRGAVVTYANETKEDLLGVRPETLQSHGAVSEWVALEMARGVQIKMKSHWAVSITGIAGPTGGTPQKPVGTVCFAVVGQGEQLRIEESMTCHFTGDRGSIQSQAADHGVEFLVQQIERVKKTFFIK